MKPRWRNPYWITLTLVVALAFAGFVYLGVNTYLRYTNPQMDITGRYYEKTASDTTVGVGDIIEVKVLVYWHGYVIPEFKRNVRIVDSFPESYFSIANGTNTLESKGYGGSYLLSYSLRVIGGEGVLIELPKPMLFIDNVEIPLTGESPTLSISSK